jgi:hypothetical protein
MGHFKGYQGQMDISQIHKYIVRRNGVFRKIPGTDGHTSNSLIDNPMKWCISKGTVDRWTSGQFIIPSSLKSGISLVTKDRWTSLKFNNKLPNETGNYKWYRGQMDIPPIH